MKLVEAFLFARILARVLVMPLVILIRRTSIVVVVRWTHLLNHFALCIVTMRPHTAKGRTVFLTRHPGKVQLTRGVLTVYKVRYPLPDIYLANT